MKRIALMALAALFCLGCGKGSKSASVDAELEGLNLGPVLADSSLAYFHADSSVVGVGDYDRATQVIERDHYWLVDYAWFFLPHRPLQFKTFAEMHALEKAGKIDSSTVVSTIVYRMGIEADDQETLMKRTNELRPKVPPPVLNEAVEAYVSRQRAQEKKN